MKSREQFYALTAALAGIVGMQIGLYELVQGKPVIPVYALLICGSTMALLGFDRYRRIEDQEEES